ncbi:MAG: hypothetical protein LBB25_01090 [Holosporaceae bacterium]|nr:hypothetical protein [Holosporaceae bacterium]
MQKNYPRCGVMVLYTAAFTWKSAATAPLRMGRVPSQLNLVPHLVQDRDEHGRWTWNDDIAFRTVLGQNNQANSDEALHTIYEFYRLGNKLGFERRLVGDKIFTTVNISWPSILAYAEKHLKGIRSEAPEAEG